MKTLHPDDPVQLELISRGLPPVAFIDNADGLYGDSPIIAVQRGETGYFPIHTALTAAELNADAGVTDAQAEAMLAGSMFGWDVKAAFPVPTH